MRLGCKRQDRFSMPQLCCILPQHNVIVFFFCPLHTLRTERIHFFIGIWSRKPCG